MIWLSIFIDNKISQLILVRRDLPSAAVAAMGVQKCINALFLIIKLYFLSIIFINFSFFHLLDLLITFSYNSKIEILFQKRVFWRKYLPCEYLLIMKAAKQWTSIHTCTFTHRHLTKAIPCTPGTSFDFKNLLNTRL